MKTLMPLHLLQVRPVLYCMWACFIFCFLPTQVVAEGDNVKQKRWNPIRQETTREDLKVESIRLDEDHLFLNEERFRLTHRTKCFNREGKRVPARNLPEQGTVELRYEKRPKNEEHPYGSKEKILLMLRVLPSSRDQGSR